MYLINRIVFELKEFHKNITNICGKSIFRPIRIYRNKKIINKDLTIISNNCWGGGIYQKLNLPYTSPTVGVYFYADDYIKFISNLEHYLSITPKIIPIEKSKYKDEIKKLKVYRYFPIGLIDDVEVIFLHYRSDEEAIIKWERRKKRVNMNNLIVKFNDQNGCTEQHLKCFSRLEYDNKICFTAKPYIDCDNLHIVPQKQSNYIKSDMRFFSKPINMIEYINNMVK